jgi:hypothetical protein
MEGIFFLKNDHYALVLTSNKKSNHEASESGIDDFVIQG